MNAFPNAKRIVYSTCSLFPEENERVITNVVKTSRAKWRVQDVNELLKGQWNNFGSGMYGSMGTRCMYARPESDLTTGFFLAVLDRDQKDLEKAQDNIKKTEKSKNKKRKADTSIDKVAENGISEKAEDTMIEQDDLGSELKLKSKNKKLKNDHDHQTATEDTEVCIQNTAITSTEGVDETLRKKKKKRKNDEYSEVIDDITENLDELVVEEPEIPKKKKKKESHEYVDIEVTVNKFENNEANENMSKKKKKKKRKKDIDENDTQHEEPEEESESIAKKKKSKKRDIHVLEMTENNSVDELSEVPNKKRRK